MFACAIQEHFCATKANARLSSQCCQSTELRVDSHFLRKMTSHPYKPFLELSNFLQTEKFPDKASEPSAESLSSIASEPCEKYEIAEVSLSCSIARVYHETQTSASDCESFDHKNKCDKYNSINKNFFMLC